MLSWFCGTPRVDEWELCILDVTITLRLPSFTMSKVRLGGMNVWAAMLDLLRVIDLIE